MCKIIMRKNVQKVEIPSDPFSQQGVRALGDSLDSLVDREDDSFGEDL